MRRPLHCWLGALLLLLTCAGVKAAASDPTTAPATTQSADDPALNPVIPSVDLNAVTIEKAINTLREKSGVNIIPRWHAIEGGGISRQTPITLRVANLSLQRVLVLLGEVAIGDAEMTGLSARAERGVVIVTVADELRPTVLRLYDVRDLVESDAATHAHRHTGAALFPTIDPATQPAIAAVTESLDRLKMVLMESIEPESWREAGGTEGSIHEFNGKLVISHTPAVHKRIAELLEMLRAK